MGTVGYLFMWTKWVKWVLIMGVLLKGTIGFLLMGTKEVIPMGTLGFYSWGLQVFY